MSLADYDFIPGNEGHCPIAEALRRQDPDILVPRANDKTITFSRRSTGLRYVYQTPINAVRFIHAVDAILETKEIPEDLKLVLTDLDLISARPRTRRNSNEVLRQAHSQNDLVHVENGKIIVEPSRPMKKLGPKPKRLNTAIS